MWCFILLRRCRQWTRFRFIFFLFLFLEIQKDGIQFAACNKRTLNTIAKVTIFCVIEHLYPFFFFSFLDRAGERERPCRRAVPNIEDLKTKKKIKTKPITTNRLLKGLEDIWCEKCELKTTKNNRFQQYILPCCLQMFCHVRFLLST